MQTIENKKLKTNLDVLLFSLNVYKQNPIQENLRKIIICLFNSMISAKSEEELQSIRDFLEESKKYEYVSDKWFNTLINYCQSSNINQAKQLLDERKQSKEKSKTSFVNEYASIIGEYENLNDGLHQLEDFRNLYRRTSALIETISDISEFSLIEAKGYKAVLDEKSKFLLQIINKIEYVFQVYSALTNYAESFTDENELGSFETKIYVLETELNEIKDYLDLGYYNKITEDIENFRNQINSFSSPNI